MTTKSAIHAHYLLRLHMLIFGNLIRLAFYLNFSFRYALFHYHLICICLIFIFSFLPGIEFFEMSFVIHPTNQQPSLKSAQKDYFWKCFSQKILKSISYKEVNLNKVDGC